MFRKFLIAAVASLALLAPLAMPAQSEARGVRVHRSAGHRYVHRSVGHRYVYRNVVHRGNYTVYYRSNNSGIWRSMGTYGSRSAAVHQAQYLRGSGQAYVR